MSANWAEMSTLRTTKKTFFSTYISIFIFSDNRGQNVTKHPWNFMFFSFSPLSPHLPPPQSCGEVLKQPERLSRPSTTLKQGEGGRKLHCFFSCGEVLKQPERLSRPSTTLKQGEGGRKLHCFFSFVPDCLKMLNSKI